MINWIQKKRNKKGFTLIELIVVIAILGILAAIAIPRFAGLRTSSSVKADASTARSIISAARIHETNTGTKVTTLQELIDAKLLAETTPVTGTHTKTDPFFIITGGGDDPYTVTFTPIEDFAPHDVDQVVVENEGKWEIKP